MMTSGRRSTTAITTLAVGLAALSAVGSTPAGAAVVFEQDHRVTALMLQSGTDAFATKNAFGAAFVGSARTGISTSLSQSVQDGSTSWLLEMPDLSDLSGTSSSAFTVGIVNGHPRLPGGNPTSYDGSSDLDWWYDQSPADVDSVGGPLHELPASAAAKTLSAGPGSTRLLVSLGAPALLDLAHTWLRATAGPSTTPLTSTNGFPPGHLPEEGLPQDLTSFATTSNGQLVGDITAASLAATPIPASFVGAGLTSCSQSYTAAETFLDLLVSGCTVFGILQVKATQPDGSVVAGSSYVFTKGATSNHVTGCTRNGVTAALADCLADATYSVAFTFTTDRVIVRRPVPGPPTAVTAQRGNGSATVSWSAPAANGGPAPSSYQVTASPGGQTCTWSSGPLSCLVPGLTNGASYTFTVTAINAAGTGPPSSPSAAVVPAQTFTDVPPSSPFAADIDWLTQRGITTGFSDGSFRPTQAVTRQAFAAYLYRYAHGGTDAGGCTPGTSSFPDVPDDSTFCRDIAWLAGTGITGGFSDGGFHPAASVSRQAAAAFFYRYNHAGADAGTCPAGTSAFADVPDSSQFCGDIKWLASTTPRPITSGFSDGFHPTAAVARQAAAAYFHRYDTDFGPSA